MGSESRRRIPGVQGNEDDRQRYQPQHAASVRSIRAETASTHLGLVCVDDGLLVAPTEESCRATYKRLVWVGWRICQRRSVGPTRCLEFCGLTLDSLGADVGGPCTRLSEERRARCQKAVGEFTRKISRRRRANRREMAKIVGELSFAANTIPAGRCFLVRLYATIHEMESEVKGKSHDHDREVTVEVGAFSDLMWWATCLRESDCVVLWRS